MATSGSSWSDLPSELLTDIARNVTELADLARFRSVCFSWRAAAAAAAAEPPPQLPWLLLPSSPSRLFFSLPEDRLYADLRLPAAASGCRRRRLYASPHGWALAVDPTDLAASLLHPFTGAARHLPALPAFFAETDDLAWDWSPHGVMASCGEGLLFCPLHPTAAAADSWKPIPTMADCAPSSINYLDGEFFVFEEDICRTTIVDAVTLAVAAVIPAPAVELAAEARVAVVGDELILLVKSKWTYLFGDDIEFSKAFHVDHRSAVPVWAELTGIGDRALFVDSLHGFAIEAGKFRNLRRNCIYSVSTKEANDRSRCATMVKYSVSVFSFENRSSKPIACRLNGLEMASRGESPSWIIPSLSDS